MEWRNQEGSVTIFLTFIFILFFSLTTTVIDSGRIFSGEGYVGVCGHNAAQSVFGNYNQELFKEYDLFGYGGYNGLNELDLGFDFEELLRCDLSNKPSHTTLKYSNLYGFQNCSGKVIKHQSLLEEDQFMNQVTSYVKTLPVEWIREYTNPKNQEEKESVKNQKKTWTTSINTEDKFQKGELEENEQETKEKQQDNNSKEEEQEKDLKKKKWKEAKENDKAGGNPIKFMNQLGGDGLLGLVCDKKNISKGIITPISENDMESVKETSNGKSEKNFLNSYIQENIEDESFSEKTKEKTMLVLYGSQHYDNYIHKTNRTEKYGWEYLVGGEKEEKENLKKVVHKMIFLRTLSNYIYVRSNSVMVEKSLVTATAIAGATGLPPAITAMQELILLILAMEESCVDVCVMMEGEKVPLIKDATTFQMKYEEICLGSYPLFHKKGKRIGRIEHAKTGKLGYEEYLKLMMCGVSHDKLRKRSMDLIQDDLQHRYNQTFSIGECITKVKLDITYEMPLSFSRLAGVQQGGRRNSFTGKVNGKSKKQGNIRCDYKIEYGYH